MRKLKIKKHTHDSEASLLSQQSPKSFEIGDYYLFIYFVASQFNLQT